MSRMHERLPQVLDLSDDRSTSLLSRRDVEFLTVRELADAMRVSVLTIRRLVERRELPVYRFCRKILFKRTDVNIYLKARRVSCFE